MGGWRRAVQLGARLVRSSGRQTSCRPLTAAAGEHKAVAAAFLWTCSRCLLSIYLVHSSTDNLGCTRCFASAASTTLHPQAVWSRTLRPLSPGQWLSCRTFADLPAHSELTMPSLSPTMNQVCLCKHAECWVWTLCTLLMVWFAEQHSPRLLSFSIVPAECKTSTVSCILAKCNSRHPCR